MREVPKIIQDVGFDFNWAEKKVWQLDVPVEGMNISELEWHFDIPFWHSPGGYYNLAPREVIDKPEKHRARYERIMNTNLYYPLDIMFWKNRWLMLDGLHRLAKAKVLGRASVKVRKIPPEYISQIKK